MAFVPGPITLNIGQAATAELQGFDQNGNPIDFPAGVTVSFSIDNTSVASSTPNADNLTDVVAALAAGTANLTATLNGFTTASGGTLSDTEAVTVVPAPAVLTSVKLAFEVNS